MKQVQRRLLLIIPTLLFVLTIVFALLRLIPGDPVVAMLGESAQPADLQAMRHELMLDRPLIDQYVSYITNLFQGQLGASWSFKVPITQLIIARLPATAELGAAAMGVALLISFPLGLLSAMKANSFLDRISSLLAVSGVAMPHFWLGPLLILFFSIFLGWFPVSGEGDLSHLILPAITLGTALAAILTRMLRSSLLEELNSDYVRTARAKGAGRLRILFIHVLRNAFPPVLTILGLQLGSLLTGAIITETIFSWPGIGRLMIQAIFSRDYPLVQGCLLVFALIYVLMNALVDVTHSLLDPRIRQVQTA